jgi:hypothetical protein
MSRINNKSNFLKGIVRKIVEKEGEYSNIGPGPVSSPVSNHLQGHGTLNMNLSHSNLGSGMSGPGGIRHAPVMGPPTGMGMGQNLRGPNDYLGGRY